MFSFSQLTCYLIGFVLIVFLSIGCKGESPKATNQCGDNKSENGEVCDGIDLRGETCESQGLPGGDLACLADCTGFDTSGCGSECGDETISGDEVCDVANLGGETCESQGFPGGDLACLADCTGFDTSGCGDECGDEMISGDEVCDGANFGGKTCESQGFYGGDLACLTDCTGLDTSGCGGECGDQTINGDEVCDGSDLGGETCESQGFYDGNLECLDNCGGFDTSSCFYDPLSVTWVSISGGTFDMGNENGEDNEKPVHTVNVPSFEMSKSQVTVEQYGECILDGVCTEPEAYGHCNWNEPGYEDHPVNCLTWEQAKEFCEWTGGRLPSEAEWEYAAKSGGQDITYPWGNEQATCDYAVMDEGTGPGCQTDRTWPVCSKTAGNTAQGLCDMAGNVMEWIEDDYHFDYEGAPTDGGPWIDVDPRGYYRVKRGGSYSATAENRALQTTWRNYVTPSVGSSHQGFRCAK